MVSATTLKGLNDRTSSTKPPDRQIPEIDHTVEEENFRPYLGNVDHGAPVRSKDYNTELDDDMNEDQLVHFDTEPKPVEPVPVYIVSTSQPVQTQRSFRAIYAAVSAGQPARIVGEHLARSRVRIYNSGDKTVWISDDPSTANPLSGFPIGASTYFELNTINSIYGQADTDADTIGLRVIEEFDLVV